MGVNETRLRESPRTGQRVAVTQQPDGQVSRGGVKGLISTASFEEFAVCSLLVLAEQELALQSTKTHVQFPTSLHRSNYMCPEVLY